jgi:hypothetical protein
MTIKIVINRNPTTWPRAKAHLAHCHHLRLPNVRTTGWERHELSDSLTSEELEAFLHEQDAEACASPGCYERAIRRLREQETDRADGYLGSCEMIEPIFTRTWQIYRVCGQLARYDTANRLNLCRYHERNPWNAVRTRESQERRASGIDRPYTGHLAEPDSWERMYVPD